MCEEESDDAEAVAGVEADAATAADVFAGPACADRNVICAGGCFIVNAAARNDHIRNKMAAVE